MKTIRIFCGVCLFLVCLLVISPPAAVLAQDEVTYEDKLELLASFPKVEITSGQSVEFSVRLRWWGSEDRTFDLLTTAPKGWTVYCKPSYEETRITAIRLEPGKTEYPETIKVVATPPFYELPEPGEYIITLEANSGAIKDTTELTAIITAKYDLDLVPTLERYSTSAKAGQDNYFSVDIQNWGTGTVDSIAFSSYKPEGWTIDFSPNRVDSLADGDFQTIEVNIKPPPRTISGDYVITLRGSGEQVSAENIKIRVTVETPSVWGWVGIVIIVLVIAGLVFVIMRFSRR